MSWPFVLADNLIVAKISAGHNFSAGFSQKFLHQMRQNHRDKNDKIAGQGKIKTSPVNVRYPTLANDAAYFCEFGCEFEFTN